MKCFLSTNLDVFHISRSWYLIWDMVNKGLFDVLLVAGTKVACSLCLEVLRLGELWSSNTTSQNFWTKIDPGGFSTPRKINMEAKNHPIEIRKIIWTKPSWLQVPSSYLVSERIDFSTRLPQRSPDVDCSCIIYAEEHLVYACKFSSPLRQASDWSQDGVTSCGLSCGVVCFGCWEMVDNDSGQCTPEI